VELDRFIASDILQSFEIRNHRNAAQILSTSYPSHLEEILGVLRMFKLTMADIRKSGGNESDITKRFASLLRRDDWFTTKISADLLVAKETTRPLPKKTKGRQNQSLTETYTKAKYLDGHLIDFVKGPVALDFEWNSKDQTYDRDLYAFRAFFESGAIEVGVIVTRSEKLNPVFKKMGKDVMAKYGASTTWMGKLDYRLEAGRGGGCPILVFGITPVQISDWEE
jgi:CRISPR-associated protein Csd2